MAPQWYLTRESVTHCFGQGGARKMAALQSQACLLATTCATITLILKGDPVPEAFSLSDVFVLMEHFLRFPLCAPVSDSNGKHAQSEDKPSICSIC